MRRAPYMQAAESSPTSGPEGSLIPHGDCRRDQDAALFEDVNAELRRVVHRDRVMVELNRIDHERPPAPLTLRRPVSKSETHERAARAAHMDRLTAITGSKHEPLAVRAVAEHKSR